MSKKKSTKKYKNDKELSVKELFELELKNKSHITTIILFVVIFILKLLYEKNFRIFRERLYIYFLLLSNILIIYFIFYYIYFKYRYKKSYKQTFKVTFVKFICDEIMLIISILIFKIIMMLLSKLSISNLKKDLRIFKDFIQNVKTIDTVDDLKNKASELIDQKLSLNKKYEFNDKFLFSTLDQDLFVHYYLAKYPNDCSYDKLIIVKKDAVLKIENKWGFLINDRNESINYIQNIINNVCKNKRFVFFRIDLQWENVKIGHAVLFIVDKERKTVEYFDPNIRTILYFNKNKEESKYTLDEKELIESILNIYFKNNGYREEEKKFNDEFINEYGICLPKNNHYSIDKIIGLQALDFLDEKRSSYSIEKGGYCVNWSWFYLDERLKEENRNLSQIEVVKKLIKNLNDINSNDKTRGYIRYIRHIALFHKGYELIRDKYLFVESKDFSKIVNEVFTSS